MSDVDELRALLGSALATIDTKHPARVPMRVDHRDDCDLRFWFMADFASVHTINETDQPAVYFSARDASWWPDWTAMLPAEARQMAQALLAAADDAESDLKRPPALTQAPADASEGASGAVVGEGES